MDLKSCSVAISDEWTVPAVKHRRSTSEFGLVKGDGCLKEFKGWRFEARIDGYYLDGSGSWDPGQILPFCLRFPSLSICKDLKVGEEEVRAFSYVEKNWGGLVLPFGHAPIVSTALCVSVDNSFIFIGVLPIWEGMYGRMFSDKILEACSKICIKAMSCLIAAEIYLPTGLKIYRVPDVMGRKDGIDLGFGRLFEQGFVLQGSGDKEVGLSTFDFLTCLKED
ncbi:hypothetical protein V6N13_015961 [Hibiscus sabdariffa]